jgi:hypothetical protein
VQILCTKVLLFFRFRSHEIAADGRQMPSILRSVFCRGVPTLKPNDFVVLDNLRVHKLQGHVKRSKLQEQSCFTCLFAGLRSDRAAAKLKALLRKAADRSVESLGIACLSSSPNECANYFRNSGYVASNLQNALLPNRSRRGVGQKSL